MTVNRYANLSAFRMGIVLILVAGVAPAAWTADVHLKTAATPRFKAIAFDYFVLFNPDSVMPEVERVFPGNGREMTKLWRTRQFEYSWLRSITDRYVDFFAVTEDALAGAKAFGYPTFWVNRFDPPIEELGIRPDGTSANLEGLINFVLSEPAVR